MQPLGDMAGVISPDELYTLDAFKRRLGISEATLRSARRAGLKVSHVHNRAFIYGGDWIAYVRQFCQTANRSSGESSSDPVVNLANAEGQHG